MKVKKSIEAGQIAKLPRGFSGYFWDCDFNALNLRIYREFILKRLLQYGGENALFWILKNFSNKEVVSFLRTKRAGELDRRSYLFWTNLSKMRNIWQRK